MRSIGRPSHLCMVFALGIIAVFHLPTATGQPIHAPPYLAIGDSIAEGVQSLDASFVTQPNAYPALVSNQLGAPMTLPYILTTPFSLALDTSQRSRLFPYEISPNLGVAAHRVSTALRLRAAARRPEDIENETDLVQFPKMGSQIEIAEFWSAGAEGVLASVWLGNNDVLGAIQLVDRLRPAAILDAMTPADSFRRDFREIVQRLDRAGIRAAYANLPDVTSVGYLFGPDELVTFTGSDQGLTPGSFTSLPAMILFRLGIGVPPEDFPDYVLDPSEIDLIQDRLQTFNDIIREEATAVGAPIVDINQVFADAVAGPPEVGGFVLQRTFTGGIFSLDGFHPSNSGQLIVARAFIDTLNQAYQTGIPDFSETQVRTVARWDPFIDHDGDGRVSGRPFFGALETVMFLLGISGDFIDLPAPAARGAGPPAWDVSKFEQIILPSKGSPAVRDKDADRQRVVALFRYLYGV